ncbi:MAG TPA: peptidoglycan editing factor PgeF [Acetobacteraceae bacterium]|nr:peptidoglycan editing factor PgeF [Acetobacteraceae bacterium]
MNGFAPALTIAGLAAPHGFFTRQGGVSSGPYATLNCGLATGDVYEAVLENRSRAARAIGADPARLFVLKQVHGAEVMAVGASAWDPGAEPKADAMVSSRPGAVLGIVTADCAPVLLADAEAGVIGAAHAGWRGAVAGVLEATLAAMRSLGAMPARIRAAIGPAIHQPSYEVGPDLRDAVLGHDAGDERFFAPGRREDRWFFDLPGYCAARLTAAGLGSVTTLAADTAADAGRFFSHRRRTLAGGGPIGHQISLIMLPAS